LPVANNTKICLFENECLWSLFMAYDTLGLGRKPPRNARMEPEELWAIYRSGLTIFPGNPYLPVRAIQRLSQAGVKRQPPFQPKLPAPAAD